MGKKEKKDDIECNLCGKTYKSLTWYNKHMITAHPNTGNADVPPTTNASSSAGVQCTDDTSTIDSIPSTSTSQPSTSNAGNPNEDDEDDSDEDDEAAERAAAEKLDWGDWSGTDEEEEIESYIVMEPWREEEEEEARRSEVAGQVTVNLKPKKTPPPALVKCQACQTPFSTLDGYIKHMVGHGLKMALLQMPTKDRLSEECTRLASAVLQEMGHTKLLHGAAKKVADLALDLDLERHTDEMILFVTTIFDSLYNFLEGDRVFSLPSVFVAEFQKHAACVSVNPSLNETLKEIISKKTECSNVECNIFVANFVSKFSSKLLAHLLRVLRDTDANSDCVNLEDRYAQTHQSTVSLDFKQNMHFIGGSNVKSVLKRALSVKHRNEEWRNVISVVRNNFIISEFSEAPEAELRAWTDAVDRGKLTKISAKALDFFVQLGKEVKPLERLDGSLINDEVIQAITKSPYLLLRWDELKGSLNEAESFKLLHALTYHFCVTWRNGVIGRRHDEMAAAKEAEKFGTGGVAFRAKLGGKKKSK